MLARAGAARRHAALLLRPTPAAARPLRRCAPASVRAPSYATPRRPRAWPTSARLRRPRRATPPRCTAACSRPSPRSARTPPCPRRRPRRRRCTRWRRRRSRASCARAARSCGARSGTPRVSRPCACCCAVRAPRTLALPCPCNPAPPPPLSPRPDSTSTPSPLPSTPPHPPHPSQPRGVPSQHRACRTRHVPQHGWQSPRASPRTSATSVRRCSVAKRRTAPSDG